MDLALGDLDEAAEPQAGPSSLTFPVLSGGDLERVAQTISTLFSPSTSSNPDLAKHLQHELQQIQSRDEAWGLIAGLASHEDANVRFFSAHTAQVKTSRDWATLPPDLHASLYHLVLRTLSDAVSPSNPLSWQPGNAVVIRKLFGCLASLLLRLPFHLTPHPLSTPLQTLASACASAQPLPPSAPASGYSTPGGGVFATSGLDADDDTRRLAHRMRMWGLEWLGICVEEIGRAGISEQKRNALRRHLESDMPSVMMAISTAMAPPPGSVSDEERVKEAEGACRCAESWIGYGIGADELTSLLPSLYGLLPHPSASSALVEVLSESIFKFGKGAKILTEPLVAIFISQQTQQLLGSAEGEPSEEVIGLAKLLCGLIEHSSEWIVARMEQGDVQALLGVILRLTDWAGSGAVDENVSELTLPIYPLLQEALMDSPAFQAPHETDPSWQIAKSFFGELVGVTRRKVRWPGQGEGAEGGGLGGMDREDREAFEGWRRDAGEVIVGAYYILREDMLRGLVLGLRDMCQANADWQDIEATMHCVRFSSEAVPLGESDSLPILFGEDVLGRLSQRPLRGKGEERLRLTVVSTIQAYEEWFKFHPAHLLPVLSYLVPSLTSTPAISRAAADALKALCDICRNKLVEHVGAFAELHGKIGEMGADEQVKVIQGITSVIQALSPLDAIGPVEGIVDPILARLSAATSLPSSDPNAIPLLVQGMNALTACFKGLSPSDDDMFDLVDEGAEDASVRDERVRQAREDERLRRLRARTEEVVRGVVGVWNGDGEVADALSSLIKHSTLSPSDTLISLPPLPLLSLVTSACERSPSALWMSLASTLVLRINSPPSPLTRKKDKTPEEEQRHAQEEAQRWEAVGDSAGRLVVVASGMLGVEGGMRDNPDVVEGWFKFCSAMSSRFPGVLLRLPSQLVEAYVTLGILGLSAQERFSLKTACDFFVALLANTRFPSPLEPLASSLLSHFGPQILRGLLLSAGSEGPRSVIPNLAELLAGLATRVKGEELKIWLDGVFAEEGFPDPRATPAAKSRLKEVVLRSRTAKKMREALHEFALVARGLDNTTYGNATAV